MSQFQQSKVWLAQLLGLPKDALHIYVGLLIFFASAAAFRWPLRSPKPLGIVVLAALAGEAWDIFDTWRTSAPQQWRGNWHDLWNTCLWPAVLFLLARYTRILRR